MTDAEEKEVPSSPSPAATPADSGFVWTSKHSIMLAVVCAAHVLETVDIAIVNVALPEMKAQLGFAGADVSWVVNGYLVGFGGFLLLCGRAGDLLGRRRVLLAGLAVFTVSSLVAGLAPNATTLVVMRGVQGVSAALIGPMTLAILASIFPDGPRAKAIAIWGMLSGISGSAGLLIGGLLTDGPGWRWIFLINVPITLGVIAATLIYLEYDRPARTHRRFDLFGSVLATAGLTLLVFAIVQTGRYGWGSTRSIGLLFAAVALLVYFVLYEAFVAKEPLLPLSLFRLGTVTGANVAQALVGSGMFVLFYLATLYQQNVLHYSALETGLAYLPLNLTIIGFARLTPKFVGRYGLRIVVTAGALVAAVGLASLALVTPQGSYLVNILAPSIVLGAGIALTFLPLALAAVTGIPAAERGVASGLVNMSRIVGGALGLAIVASIATSYTNHKLATGAAPQVALTNGFQLGFVIGAVLLVLAAVTAFTLLPPKQAAPAKG